MTAAIGTAPATFFPASEKRGIVGVYSIVITEKWEGREGEGFNANLKLGRKIVGAVTQEGRGGQTTVDYVSTEAREAFNDFVKLWDWDETYGAYTISYNEEHVLDALAHEALEIKSLNAVRKFQFVPVDAAVGTIYSYKIPASVKGAKEVPIILAGRLNAGDKFWNKVEWVVVK